jgi:hypothetical protein
MDVNTVTMEPEAAEKAFREYRAAFMAERNRIDGQLMRGYKALAEGKTVIGLTDAMTTAGADELGRPRLAIARADESQIQMRIDGDGSFRFDPDFWGRARSEDRLFSFPVGVLPPPPRTEGLDEWREPWNDRWTATLPFIPPQYRPPLAMQNYHLLWEAEWRRARGSQRKDPMLLRRIGGDMFAVVAAWDLTEVEKLVLAR